jgi:hypothetical protein
MTQQAINDHLVLISGKSATGKSASLEPLKDRDDVLYLNFEAGKKLPFKNNFTTYNLEDPYDAIAAFDQINTKASGFENFKVVIIDSLSFLLDRFESKYVVTAKDTREAWGKYSQFFKELMQVYIASCPATVIVITHTSDVLNETEKVRETIATAKGSLRGSIEAYFSVVVSSKKIPVKTLEPFKNKFLNITEDEKLDQYKYVFQTRLTADTVNERIRGPLGMWTRDMTYIDNNVGHLIQVLNDYYS